MYLRTRLRLNSMFQYNCNNHKVFSLSVGIKVIIAAVMSTFFREEMEIPSIMQTLISRAIILHQHHEFSVLIMVVAAVFRHQLINQSKTDNLPDRLVNVVI